MIRVVHVFPPVPTRQYDYMVYDDNEAENPRCVGFGPTPWEALSDYAEELKELNYLDHISDQPEAPPAQPGALEGPGRKG